MHKTATSVIAVTPSQNFNVKPHFFFDDIDFALSRFSTGSLRDYQRLGLERGFFEQIAPSRPWSSCYELNDCSQPTLPSFLKDYWKTIQKRGLLAKNTIRAVAEAVQEVFGEDLARWDALMFEALVHGNVQVSGQPGKITDSY